MFSWFTSRDDVLVVLLLGIAVHVRQARFSPASGLALVPVAHARSTGHEALLALIAIRRGGAVEAATRAELVGR